MANNKHSFKPSTHEAYSDSSGGPPMDTYFDKYLDSRFTHLDDSISEIRKDVKGWKLWIVGMGVSIFIGLTTIIIALLAYHANIMQSQFNHHVASTQAQMQSFSDYVKVVTQPQAPQKPSK